MKRLGQQSYKLKLPPTWKIHLVFDVKLLSPFNENNVYETNFIELPPKIIDDQEEFEVEDIINHRKDKWYSGEIKFKVCWKGYSSANDTWEPEQALSNTNEVLSKYKKRHKL